MRGMRSHALFCALLLGGAGCLLLAAGPHRSAQAGDLHDASSSPSIQIDLHVDPLLWNQDLNQRREVHRRSGHVDFVKMREGGVNAAIFGIVTQGLPLIGGFGPFTWWQGWPGSARQSPWHAALYQLEQLRKSVERSAGKAVWVEDAGGLEQAASRGQLAVMVGVEGAQALDGEVERVQALRQAGVLYMGPVHLTGNALAGSSFPYSGTGGVTPYGWQVIKAMEKHGIWIDMAHLSPQAFWEVVRGTTGPVLCSHTGVAGVTPHWRNLDDAQLRAIADRGGIIGIMAAPQFLGGKTLAQVVRHIQHTVSVVGIGHVAIGSDLDGFIVPPDDFRDISRWRQLRNALLATAFSPADVDAILGGNFVRMLKQFRPRGPE